MKKDNINYLMVGSFVLAMLILLVVTLYKITGRGANSDTYYVHFKNVNGIREGTVVTYGGFQIGQLLGISPMREEGKTKYKLELGIRPDWDIPTDSVARIVSPGLLSDSQIEISEGDSENNLKSGDTIKGAASLNIMALFDSMGDDFQDLTEQGIKPLLKGLTKQIDSSIPRITEDTSRLLISLNKSAEQLTKILNSENQKHLSNVFANADKITTNLSNLSEGLNRASQQIDQLLATSNDMLTENGADIRKAVLDLRASLDTVSENIDSIVYNMDVTSRNMNEFSRQIRDNPGVLLSGKPPNDEGEAKRK